MLILREMQDTDLEIFFEHEQEEEGNQMAAFTNPAMQDKAVFLESWAKRLANPTVIQRVIEVDGKVAGSIASFIMFDDERNVGYRLGRAYWGKGIASQALAEFLKIDQERPLFGRCVNDNLGSKRVLEKCGFKLIGTETAFAEGRGAEVEELIFRLD